MKPSHFSTPNSLSPVFAPLLVIALLSGALDVFPTTNCYADEPAEKSVRHIAILIDHDSSDAVKHAARILSERIRKRSNVVVDVVNPSSPTTEQTVGRAELFVVVGTPDTSTLTKDLMSKLGTRLPVLPHSNSVHPESFAVKSGFVDGSLHLVIAGSEPRAAIYGVVQLSAR